MFPRRSPGIGFAIALLTTAVATLFRFAIGPIVGSSAPFTIYTLGIVVTAWFGGFLPGLLATILGFAAGEIFFVHPVGAESGPLATSGPAEAIRLISFFLVGLSISFVSEQWHRARRRDLLKTRHLEQEIMQRLAAEEDVRQSSQTLEAIVASAPIAIAVIDPDGVVRLWNHQAERLFGWTAAEVLGRPIPNIPEQKRLESRTCREMVLRGETLRPIPTQRLRKDGTLVDVELSLAPLYDANGEVDNLVVLLNDVSERRRAEQNLIDADRRKDEFLATLAHELRNPLAPIRNGLHVMRLANGDRVAVERTRDLIERQIAQMVRLIDDLLDVSRITSGKIELRREWTGLHDAVQSAVETSRPMIDALGHELSVSLPAEPVVLDADVTRLAQAFANLLQNAAKYTERGGRISLVTHKVDDQVVVCVRDTGIGISPDLLPHVFDLFMQADRSMRRSHGGLGVGLTLVKRIVEMHGGNVEARSDGTGRGSEFVITLPAVALPPAVLKPSTSPLVRAVPPALRRRVLVVDDNEDSVESLAILLSMMGHESATASDGVEAIHVAESFRPDTILLDLGMPRMSGCDACRAIRGEPWGKAITMVALTGWGQVEDRVRTREAGFDHHLVKPVEPAALAELLRTPARASTNAAEAVSS